MKTISRGDGEQMLAAFESKLDELQYSDIHSSTEVEESTKSVVIPDYAKDTFYKDVGGGFGGENGEVYSLEEIMQMWNSEHDNDPCMMEYDSFDDWFADTETNCLQEYWPDDIEECTDVTASIDYDKLDEIADRYSASKPVSGDWSSETEHELNAISNELRVSRQEAIDLMVNYLGFDEKELAQYDELQHVTSATIAGSSSDYDSFQIVNYDGNKYAVNYNEINSSSDADPMDMLHSFEGQVTSIRPQDDEDPLWASFKNGTVTYYQGSNSIDSSYYMTSDDMDIENNEWCDAVIDDIVRNLENLNKDVQGADVMSSSSNTGMKTWLVSGYNYQGKAIVNEEIEARTKNAAIHKFEKMYGNIATRAEEA